MAEKAKNASVAVELVVLADIDHNLIGPTPEKTRDANRTALVRAFDRMPELDCLKQSRLPDAVGCF